MLKIEGLPCGTRHFVCILTTRAIWSLSKALISWSLTKAPLQSNGSPTSNCFASHLVYIIFISYSPQVSSMMFFILLVHSPWAPCEECFTSFGVVHFPLRLGGCPLLSLCLYIHATCQVATRTFGGGGYYLDCSRGFVPNVEESLYNSLVTSAHEVIELEKNPEEENPVSQFIEKDVTPAKGKGKGRKPVPRASSQVSTRSYTKAFVQCFVAPSTTVVESPNPTPSAPPPDLVAAPSHSEATIPSVPCKRKVVAPDTSATLSVRSYTLSLIENVDMGVLIEDFMKTNVPPPAYRRIQDFLTKVCMSFSCLINSFLCVLPSLCLLVFFVFFSMLERAVLGQTLSLRFTRALTYFLLICLRTYVCRAFPQPHRMFFTGTNGLPITLRFCSPLQLPTFMTTTSSSLHMLLIVRSLDLFIIGHT